MDQLPGMNVLQAITASHQDLLGLATRHMTEALSVFNLGMQRFSAELAVPPALPMGLPAFPGIEQMGLPAFPGIEQMGLPGLPGMAPAAPAPAEKAAAKGYILTQREAPRLLGV